MTENKKGNSSGKGCLIAVLIVIIALVFGFIHMRNQNQKAADQAYRQSVAEEKKQDKQDKIKKQNAKRASQFLMKQVAKYQKENDPELNWSKYVDKASINSEGQLTIDMKEKFADLSESDMNAVMHGANKEAAFDAYKFNVIKKSEVGNRLFAIINCGNSEIGRSKYDIYDQYKWSN